MTRTIAPTRWSAPIVVFSETRVFNSVGPTPAFSCERCFQMTSRATARDHNPAARQLQRDVSGRDAIATRHARNCPRTVQFLRSRHGDGAQTRDPGLPDSKGWPRLSRPGRRRLRRATSDACAPSPTATRREPRFRARQSRDRRGRRRSSFLGAGLRVDPGPFAATTEDGSRPRTQRRPSQPQPASNRRPVGGRTHPYWCDASECRTPVDLE